MNLDTLIVELESHLKSNDSETCKWCERGEHGVDGDGNRTDDPDEIEEYHFSCDDDCLERLIPQALEVLRQAVEHPASEIPPLTDWVVLARSATIPFYVTAIYDNGWFYYNPGSGSPDGEMKDVAFWRLIPGAPETRE